MNQIDEDRFWSKVDKTGNCWIWTAGVDKNGYGKFSIKHLSYRAHRVCFAYFVLKDAKALFADFLVCHTCDNPGCVRPEHLFKGTPQSNMTDKVRKGRHRSPTGAECVGIKILPSEYPTIHRLVSSGAKQKDLAKKYGVSRALICRIVGKLNG